MTITTSLAWMKFMSVKTTVMTFKTMKNHTISTLTPVNYNSDAEFFQLANGMEYDRVWKIIAELMETLQVINPRLYSGVIKKLKA